MLASLRIKNLALVEELTLELPPGYIAITGETGTGKSVLIGALTLLLGERAERTLIRSGAESCLVEALFDVSRLTPDFHQQLARYGLEPCEQNQLVIKRTFTAAGANRQFVNGSPTTLQTLAEIGDRLVDLHGPHDHQSLLHPARQLELLDAFGGLEPLRIDFADQLARSRQLLAARDALVLDEAEAARQLDLLRHQVNEIQAANLQPAEDEELPLEHHRAANAARLLELGVAGLHHLGEAEPALLTQAGVVGRLLQDLAHLDPRASRLTDVHAQISSLLRELQQDLHQYVDRLEVDPQRLQQLEDRLNLVQSLKRKYGNTIESVVEFGRQARTQLQQLEGRDAELQHLDTQLRQANENLARTGADLTARRRKILPDLRRKVTAELAQLGFVRSQFDATLTTATATTNPTASVVSSSGLDRLEFQFSPNPGEPLRPLRAIASSGEMSRVMLALKTVLADQDRVPLLIFDEVDANIGGEVAHAVADKMRRLGQTRQVLCITHLAPVAARASAHLAVTKSVRDNRTFTKVTPLSQAERITELARMLGGQSDSSRRLAESLLS